MKHLQQLLDTLQKEETLHKQDVYNYAIPEAWNVYGYQAIRKLRNKQLLVHPYSFYIYTLSHMFSDKKKQDVVHHDSSWIKSASIYSFMVRSATSWDHDRDGIIHHDNLYHFADQGTFLKSIVLLPLLKRMGINTILMHQPFPLGTCSTSHDYPRKEAVVNFQDIEATLADPMIKGMSATKQCAAFIEACHFLDMQVILEYCPAMMARDNAYIKKHHDWFYWIHKDYENAYHAPVCHALPQNSLPYAYTLKDLYKSEDVINHINQFVHAPTHMKEVGLSAIEKSLHITIAPSIVDQINANISPDFDTTILRFYHDNPNQDNKESAPYMLQDSIRPDLYEGKKALHECWKQVYKNISWFQKTLHIDGVYIEKTYLLPEKLQMNLVHNAKKMNPCFVCIAEESTMDKSSEWVEKGYDMISGNSGYEESSLKEFKFHNFAYRLKGNICPLFAASEFYDSRRISSLEHGKTMAIMLSVMNHFLPNGIPMLMNGIESFDVQPLQLSEYGDQTYTYSLPREDERFHKQPYIDQYYFDYTKKDLSILPNILENISKIRKEYLDVLVQHDKATPVWFDSPQDPGIGFTFMKDKKALMVVCNILVSNSTTLHIHTDNLYPYLPFQAQTIRQIYSTSDPYVQEHTLDDFQHLSLNFEAGEVKFIEFQ